ncbi:MAG TPA: sigma-70 family RNA polymerase sigma factor [Polyangiaceae bacterium]|nr:sigma-70 family RNA polymerase sigma factor [Polyangiaceae bacterium]
MFAHAAISKTDRLEEDRTVDRQARLAALAREHFSFIWRSLRRLGVSEPAVDDATQQVFEVAARRLDDLQVGREKAFLFKTALLVAMKARRVAARARSEAGGPEIESLHDSGPSPEESALLRENRQLLDRALAALGLPERTVFVLFEIEELSLTEIAELVAIPRGTVASRLRRARELFHAEAKRLRARESRGAP